MQDTVIRQDEKRVIDVTAPAHSPSAPAKRVVYSFVVDEDPRFSYQAFHLAQSLLKHCVAEPGAIHVQFTPEVDERTRSVFRALGCRIHALERFGDGRYCNKIAQVQNLLQIDCDIVILLDTDMIAIADPARWLTTEAVLAKIVDAPNPSCSALEQIAAAAGLGPLPGLVTTDDGMGSTYPGNCNGGFYAIPRALLQPLFDQWRRWALWLLEHNGPLASEGKTHHTDQVSMWLALMSSGLPFKPAPSNLNYFVHYNGEHRYFDPSQPIAFLHYHHKTINVVGLIEPKASLNSLEATAVAAANSQIGAHFNNPLFWDFRYRHYPERGSGVGSRGALLEAKRSLLKQQNIEMAASVLDIGCGDLEVLRVFELKNYTGVDGSEGALKTARAARPDWTFLAAKLPGDEERLPQAELVLFLDVLIHQQRKEDYVRLVTIAASRARNTLIVSGYDEYNEARNHNHMIYFHEPVSRTLESTGRFSRIEKIGTSMDLTIFRCTTASQLDTF